MAGTNSGTRVAAPRDLVIVGAGGFAPEGIWVAEETNAANLLLGKKPAWNIRGFVDVHPAELQTLYSYPILGTSKGIGGQARRNRYLLHLHDWRQPNSRRAGAHSGRTRLENLSRSSTLRLSWPGKRP